MSPLALLGRPTRGRLTLGLAALVLAACAHPVAAGKKTFSTSSDDGDHGTPTVAVRTYWNAPTTSVVAWSSKEGYQGLRSSIRADGSIIRDHHVWVGAYAVPDMRALWGSNWFAFTNNMTTKTQLLPSGPARDQFPCQGADDCSPADFFSARITDETLRASKDSVVIKVLELSGAYETVLTLQPEMVTRYLAVFDSVTAVRKRKVATR